MATKLWLHQQHPSLLVSALGQFSETAHLECKCAGTARHQHVPRDVPVDSLGLAQKKKSQDAVRLAITGPTTCYLVPGRCRCRQPPIAPTLAGLRLRGGSPRTRKCKMLGSGTAPVGAGRTGPCVRRFPPLDRCARPHSVAPTGISLKGARSELVCVSPGTPPSPGEHPPPAWFREPDPAGLALMKPRLNSVQSFR